MSDSTKPTYRQLLAMLRKRGIAFVSAYEHNRSANRSTWTIEFSRCLPVQVQVDRSAREFSKRARESEARERAVTMKAQQIGLIDDLGTLVGINSHD